MIKVSFGKPPPPKKRRRIGYLYMYLSVTINYVHLRNDVLIACLLMTRACVF